MALVVLFASAGPRAASAGSDDTVELEYHTLDPRGRPLADVEVLITRFVHGEAELYRVLRSDERGQLRLAVPRAQFPTFARQHVVAYGVHPEHDVGWALLNPYMPANGWPLLLRLRARPAEDRFLHVIDPAGAPVAGARVAPTMYVQNNRNLLPEEMSERFATTTDEQGRARLEPLPREHWIQLQVEHPDFGTQAVLRDERDSDRELRLSAVKEVRGRLRGTPDQIAHRVVELRSGRSGLLSHSGASASVRSDAEGRFRVPAMAVGVLKAFVEVTEDRRSGGATPGEMPHRLEDPPTVVEIALEDAIPVHGRVVVEGSGDPVGGLVLVLSGRTRGRCTTDETGRYHAVVLPGPLSVQPIRMPAGFSSEPWASVRVETVEPEGRPLPDLVLHRGVGLRGVVRDAEGRVRGGAWVEARWRSEGVPRNLLGMSDASGVFHLQGLPEAVELELRATWRDRALASPRTLVSGSTEPLDLVLGDPTGLSLSGRVLDPDGSGVEGAQVFLWQRTSSGGQQRLRDVFEWDPGVVQFTDERGEYRVPRSVELGPEYRVRVEPPGRPIAESEWQSFDRSGEQRMVDVVLGVHRSIEGRIVDVEGRPIPDATVFQTGNGAPRSEVRTDAAGRFVLSGFTGERAQALVFVHAEGYRFTGGVAPLPDGELSWRLRRDDEPPPVPRSTLAPATSPEVEQALAKQLLRSWVERQLASSDESTRSRGLHALAQTEPYEVLERIQPVSDPWFRDYLRRAVVDRLLDEDLDEALAVVASMEAARWRSTGLLDAASRLGADDPRRLRLVDEALVEARGVVEPPARLIYVSSVLEALTDLGLHERAQSLIPECRALAEQLTAQEWDGYARASFAEELACYDPDAALELIGAMSDAFSLQRHHGNVAHELGARDPARAEQVLQRIAPGQRDRELAPVCYRMAAVDLPRALRLARQARSVYQRAHCLGVIVQGLLDAPARDVPADRLALLDEAFGDLEDQEEFRPGSYSNAFTCTAAVAASLLPLVERVAPDRLEEFLWRAMAMRPSPVAGSGELARDPTLALLVSRYDHELAAVLLQPHLPVQVEDFADGRTEDLRTLFLALAALDPASLPDLLERLASSPELHPNARQAVEQAGLEVASYLLVHGAERWEQGVKNSVGLWQPDREDG